MNERKVTKLGWITLFILTSLNILNYIDRNIFSALVPAMKHDLGFSDTELGLLGSAFIFSYTLIAPLFGYLGDRGGRLRTMSSGVLLWSLATAVTGRVSSFASQFATRVTVGFGEAGYSVISPSVIADYFPKTWRGKVFAIYSCAIPVGSALGYVIGGLLEPRVGWRHAFYAVGVPGVILCFLLLFLPEPEREAVAVAGHVREKVSAKYKWLAANKGFLFTTLGYAAYTFVVGGLAFWMPAYIVRYFPGVTMEKGNIVFGGVTVVGGFVGTVLGGWWADRIEKKSGNGYLKVSAISMLLAVPLFVFVLSLGDFNLFSAVLFVMDVALFLCISPLDAAVINYVSPELRATAVSLNIFLIHALGDGPSRVIMGAVSDGHGLRAAIEALPIVLALAGVLWFIGVVLAWQPMHWPEGARAIPPFQGHRGFRPDGSVQENTLEAFRRAKQNGATMCELDVHVSSDEEAVVFHDADLKRIASRPEFVKDLTAEQMKTWAQAPTLLEVLQDPSLPEQINIELKSDQIFGSPRLEQAVLNAVRAAGAETRVIVSSFNPFALHRMARLAPNIPRGLLVTEEPDPKNKWILRKMLLAFWARPHLLHIDQAMATPQRMRAWVDRGIPILVWTVNDRAKAEELLALGARGVISDRLFHA